MVEMVGREKGNKRAPTQTVK